MDNPGHGRSPGFAIALAVFAAGMVVGLGLAANLGGEFIAGVIFVAVLCVMLALPAACLARRRDTEKVA